MPLNNILKKVEFGFICGYELTVLIIPPPTPCVHYRCRPTAKKASCAISKPSLSFFPIRPRLCKFHPFCFHFFFSVLLLYLTVYTAANLKQRHTHTLPGTLCTLPNEPRANKSFVAFLVPTPIFLSIPISSRIPHDVWPDRCVRIAHQRSCRNPMACNIIPRVTSIT